MANEKNPSKHPLTPDNLMTPPPAVTRPRNGFQSDDALGIDELKDPSGGGKVTDPYITQAERMSRESKP